jgi:hypothetical protein
MITTQNYMRAANPAPPPPQPADPPPPPPPQLTALKVSELRDKYRGDYRMQKVIDLLEAAFA